MVIALKDLIKRVRIKMNENPVDDGLESGVGHHGLTLDQVIASVADEACERLMDNTVFSGFDDVQTLFGDITFKDGRGRLAIPSDFYRFIELKLNCWETSATDALRPDEPDYWRKDSVNPVVRGSRTSPRVYITGDRKEGWLELHPCPPGAKVEYGSYLCDPWLTPVGSYYIPDRMVAHLVSSVAEKARKVLEGGS